MSLRHISSRLGLLVITMALYSPGQAETEGLAAALTSGKAALNLRYRYEFVDQESFDDDANASTLLLRLNYTTGKWNSWEGFVEFDHVLSVFSDDFNSGAGTSSPARNRFPVVADPSGPDLNQLYLRYAPYQDWDIRVGRQRIILDDQRYVGGVAWRQNEQTYDAVSLSYGGLERTELFYSYVGNVNRIFGTEVAAGDNEQSTHLLNVDVALDDAWNVLGYAYLIDNDDVPAFSTNTFGLRVNGEIKAGEQTYALLGEFATQTDAGNAPVDYDTNYYRLRAQWKGKALSAGVGIESLGSDNGQGFRTPLATLHAFNGWADVFLATPSAGLEDVFVQAGYRYSDWNLQLVYHDFSAETGGVDFGREINASASRPFHDRYSLLLKFASFDADSDNFEDVTKFWAMVTARF